MTNVAETLLNYFAREWIGLQQDKLELSVTYFLS